MILRTLVLLALCGAMTAMHSAHAAEADEEESPSEDAAPSGNGDEKETARKPDDVFVPTEEISEDAAVPFPVDI